MTATTTDPLQEVVSCLERLRESIPRLGDREVEQQIRAVESLSRQVHAVGLELVAQLQARNLAAGGGGFGSTKRMLAGMLGLSQGEARSRVAHAEAVAPRVALTGEALPARLQPQPLLGTPQETLGRRRRDLGRQLLPTLRIPP